MERPRNDWLRFVSNATPKFHWTRQRRGALAHEFSATKREPDEQYDLMTHLVEKSAALRHAGFIYDYHHEAYIDRQHKKIMSLEFVKEESSRAIQNAIDAPECGWVFYWMTRLSDLGKLTMVKALERA